MGSSPFNQAQIMQNETAHQNVNILHRKSWRHGCGVPNSHSGDICAQADWLMVVREPFKEALLRER